MTLKFYLARLFRNETALTAYSVPVSDLLAELKDKTVALVGNARATPLNSQGPDIDRADLVIRINSAPIPEVASHGERTDWLALAIRASDMLVRSRSPDRILWMSPKRKRLTLSAANSRGFFLHPIQEFESLRNQLGAPPTTGLMLISLLEQSEAKSVSLYGFDFFSSNSLSGSRTANQVPHDFAREKAYVMDLIKRDGRFKIVPPAI